MTTLELILLCSSILFFILWLWQALILARTTRALESAHKASASILQVLQEYKLAYTTLEQMKVQVEAQQAIVENVQTMNERISAYNFHLNEIATAVREVYGTVDLRLEKK